MEKSSKGIVYHSDAKDVIIENIKLWDRNIKQIF